MKHQQLKDAKGNFLQRRYGVNLGRRYVLAAASVVMLSVFGYSQVETTTAAVTKSGVPNSTSRLSQEESKFEF
jgi:serpin B